MSEKQNWQKNFAEIAELGSVYEAWGNAAKEKLPPRAMKALVSDSGNRPDNLLEIVSAYHRTKKDILAITDYEAATKNYNAYLQYADHNMGVISSVVSKRQLRQYLPPIQDPEHIRRLAKEYNLAALSKLLPR
ncbi:MAG: hypothetical protein WCD70_09560 [Alphaproteobacteria bacterium]